MVQCAWTSIQTGWERCNVFLFSSEIYKDAFKRCLPIKHICATRKQEQKKPSLFISRRRRTKKSSRRASQVHSKQSNVNDALEKLFFILSSFSSSEGYLPFLSSRYCLGVSVLFQVNKRYIGRFRKRVVASVNLSMGLVCCRHHSVVVIVQWNFPWFIVRC